MNGSNNRAVTRRDFLKTTSCGAAAAGMGGLALPSVLAATSQPAASSPVLPSGLLGKTGFPVTLISFGAIRIEEGLGTRILKAAIDAGVNLVHTSETYGGGKSIRAVGQLFKAAPEYRDKVFLCLKSFNSTEEKELDGMLKVLNTDHADVILTTYQKPDRKRLEEIQTLQTRLKKKGKIRHTGFVCHVDMNGAMESVLQDAPDFFDMTLMAMAMLRFPGSDNKKAVDEKAERFIANLKKLREKRIGVLAMKSGARDAVTKEAKVFQAHAKSVLEHGADSVLTSINTFDQVDMVQQLDLKSPHPTVRERKAAADLQRGRGQACLMCGDCAKVCPEGVPVNDLARIRMYHQEYGWHDHAQTEYAMLSLESGRLTHLCDNCTACSEVCPVRLAGPGMVQEVSSWFA